jgi:ABC-type lipoprotein release transport system permease subunit
MVLIVVSIFDGFLHKVEHAARGLCGDIVVDNASISGIKLYDEFIDYLKDEVHEVEAATPVIHTYGLLRIGGQTNNVQICGIRLPERIAVTQFQQDMFVQDGRKNTSFDPPLERLVLRTEQHIELIKSIRKRESDKPDDKRDEHLLDRLTMAGDIVTRQREMLITVSLQREILEMIRRDLQAEQTKPANRRNDDKIQELTGQMEEVAKWLGRNFRPPEKRMILGLGLAGMSFRTPDGEVVRLITPGRRAVLSLFPLGYGMSTTITPTTATFTVIDDARTDLYIIDSNTVYVPFKTLQELTDMGPGYSADEPGKIVVPARCSQIQIKVKAPYASDRELIKVRQKVNTAIKKFAKTHPCFAGTIPADAQTWREKQAKYIGIIEKQKAVVTIMFGVISLVSVLMVFAIFHMIVTQKIRDIGVIRAVGGSAGGVMQIFLGFGAATALLGSAIGLTGGYFFVRNINEIEDWMSNWFGVRVWDREVYLFEKIPDAVEPVTMLWIAVGAIAAGLIGVLLPAIKAGRMQPVEALRYE